MLFLNNVDWGSIRPPFKVWKIVIKKLLAFFCIVWAQMPAYDFHQILFERCSMFMVLLTLIRFLKQFSSKIFATELCSELYICLRSCSTNYSIEMLVLVSNVEQRSKYCWEQYSRSLCDQVFTVVRVVEIKSFVTALGVTWSVRAVTWHSIHYYVVQSINSIGNEI